MRPISALIHTGGASIARSTFTGSEPRLICLGALILLCDPCLSVHRVFPSLQSISAPQRGCIRVPSENYLGSGMKNGGVTLVSHDWVAHTMSNKRNTAMTTHSYRLNRVR